MFKWLHHTDDIDIVIFNDYNTEGELVLNSYVHTSVNWSLAALYDCSCSAFAITQNMHIFDRPEPDANRTNGCFHT